MGTLQQLGRLPRRPMESDKSSITHSGTGKQDPTSTVVLAWGSIRLQMQEVDPEK